MAGNLGAFRHCESEDQLEQEFLEPLRVLSRNMVRLPSIISNLFLSSMVPGEGLEPSSLAAEGFESSAYTIPPPRQYRHRTLASAHRKAMRGCYNCSIMADANYVPTKYDSVFWVPTERIQPNPYQPRREFDEERLKALAESIRQYGVLQPLVVTRSEVETQAGGLQSTYELIAGERRLRASRLIGLKEVPVIIRVGEQTDGMKLELAIIENVQREDLNSIDRAKALSQLASEFGLSHGEIGAKVGRSREYVSNSIRLLLLPDAIQQAVVDKEITEGHARALLMLNDKPEERYTLFKEIVLKKTSVRM
ncbi:MAG: Chromosome partitioning protein ParB family, partial [Parcubacteria group bacterium]|nr:Chromosome partitioning protein ParB family [Parcubacteria group bacterium]